MRIHGIIVLAGALAALVSVNASAAERMAEPKVLDVPADPTKETVLVGRSLAGGMIIQFEIEPAKAMWMHMGHPFYWMEHSVKQTDLYHVEVKPIDPKSKTRISYVSVNFKAVNTTSQTSVQGVLHPMWGGSGLHYAMNSALLGDGTYEAVVTVGVPSFARDMKGKDLWMQPATVQFHFKLDGGKLVEVTTPSADISF